MRPGTQTRASFVASLAATPDLAFQSRANRTSYRINAGDAGMNCHTCTNVTSGRATLEDGRPVVRCLECLQRIGFEDA